MNNMITAFELKKKLKWVRFVESILRENGKSKREIDENMILILAKWDYRNALKKHKCDSQGVKILYDRDENGDCLGETWREMYDVEYDGTKQELIKELEKEMESIHASIRAYGHDCTGKAFMTGFKVAHVAGKKFRVLEHMALDV